MVTARGVQYFSIKRLPMRVTALLRAMGEDNGGVRRCCTQYFWALCLTRSDVLHVRSSPRVAVRFVFTFIHRLALPPPTLPRGHPIGVNPDPSASLRYPEPPRFHGRPRELFRTARNHPHHCHQTERRSKGKWMAGNRGNRRDTRFTTRPLFVARAFEPVCFPSNLNYMYIYIYVFVISYSKGREKRPA